MATEETIRYCTRCVMSSTRPRITFDEEGVCSACRYAEKKKNTINWEERERQLKGLLDRHRRNDGRWDVIVPFSGGKDSCYVAHELKYRYNMNPLTVTWAPHLYTRIGWKNLQASIHAGLDNVLATPNGPVHRKLTRLFFEKIGDPFQPFIFGQKAYPVQMAIQYDIPLIMYGENGEVEYGGDAKNEESPTHDLSGDLTRHYFSGIGPDALMEHGFSKRDMNPYLFPDADRIHNTGVECHFYGYYHKWIPQENYYYAVKHCDFEPNPERTEGTYSKYASLDDKLDGFHYYLMFIKFGIGRTTSDAAHEIRDGHLTREEGVALVRKYDGEFPKKYFKEFLEYTQLTGERFWEVVDGYRTDRIWKRENGVWKLRSQVGNLPGDSPLPKAGDTGFDRLWAWEPVSPAV